MSRISLLASFLEKTLQRGYVAKAFVSWNKYLNIIPQARVGYEMIDIKHERNNELFYLNQSRSIARSC